MEFPDLGRHCSEKSCNKLEFLPMRCDSCTGIFCSEHFSYAKHSCSAAHKKDVQVPVCPLCGDPVPTPRNVSPDVTVGRHIDEFCRSERKRIFTNQCSFKNCKKRELVPVKCDSCKRNYCLRHRHTVDHECDNQRQIKARPNPSVVCGADHIQSVQGTMSEDEAMALAMARSIQELDASHDRNRRYQQEQQRQQSVPCGDTNHKCIVS